VLNWQANNLAAESLPFAMDFYYMHVWAEWNFVFTEFGQITAHDITGVIQYWCGSPTDCPNYYQDMLANVSSACWVSGYYGGTAFTVAPATGTAIPAL
jgi:hypothetical protein